MRVALIHDYLNQSGGAERVLEALHGMYPDAPVYTSIYDAQAMPPAYRQWDIRPSFMQRLPGWRRHFRKYFLLYPSAFEAFDLSAYDLVISSSSAYAKGVITRPGAVHVCYCHTPMRFAWRASDYVEREQIGGAMRAVLPVLLTYLRMWDVQTAGRVGTFVANSRTVQARIAHIYQRESTVLPPPVELAPYAPQVPDDFFLAGGRLVPYKRLDLAVRACSNLHLPLVVFGAGRDREALERIAGPTIRFVGKVDTATLHELYARCRAYLMPGEEDAGIQPLEAMGAGRPVIALRAGGALDSVVEGQTGLFFDEPAVAALEAALHRFAWMSFEPARLRLHAESFARPMFTRRMQAIIDAALDAANRGGEA